MDINIPKAGLTMTEATIGKWLVEEGETVQQGQVILEVTTEKISIEVEAPADGTIESILKREGEEAQVGETVAKLTVTGAVERYVADETGKAERDNSSYDADVAVIGGGPGGYAAAIRAAQLGGKVVLVEEKYVGGTCLNAGCIPTKTLLNAVQTMELARKAAEFGIHFAEPQLDLEQLTAFKNNVVSQLRKGIEKLLEKYGVVWLKGRGIPVSPRIVEVNENGRIYQIHTKMLILASGGKASIPPIPGLPEAEPVFSEDLLEKVAPIRRLGIIGSGAIGVEFATLYAGLGSKVVLLEREERILPRMDAECSSFLTRALKKRGVEVYTGVEITQVTRGRQGKEVHWKRGEESQVFACDEILVASGWHSGADFLQGLGLEGNKSGVRVNSRMQTSAPGIFAVGDLTGIDNLAHVAMEQGIVAAENCMGTNSEMDHSLIPRCVYTWPEIASVGLTEEEAASRRIDYDVGKVYFQGNGMALAKHEADGFVKVLIGTKYRDLIGVHIVGPHASELISDAVVAMKLEATAEEFIRAVRPHPTLSEALGEAVRNALGVSVHS